MYRVLTPSPRHRVTLHFPLSIILDAGHWTLDTLPDCPETLDCCTCRLSGLMISLPSIISLIHPGRNFASPPPRAPVSVRNEQAASDEPAARPCHSSRPPHCSPSPLATPPPCPVDGLAGSRHNERGSTGAGERTRDRSAEELRQLRGSYTDVRGASPARLSALVESLSSRLSSYCGRLIRPWAC